MQVRHTAITPSAYTALGGQLLEVEETTKEVTRPLIYTFNVSTITIFLIIPPIPSEGKSTINLGEGLKGLLWRAVDTWGGIPVGGEAV